MFQIWFLLVEKKPISKRVFSKNQQLLVGFLGKFPNLSRSDNGQSFLLVFGPEQVTAFFFISWWLPAIPLAF